MPQTTSATSESGILPLEVIIPVAADFQLVSLKGREAISECFWFDLEMTSDKFNIESSHLIGKPVTVLIPVGDDVYRFINGCVSEFTIMSTVNRRARYKARVVPKLWFLTQTTDCVIYQNKTVQQIIRDVLTRAGIKDFKFNLYGEQGPREYCVQYRETSYNFIMRLMEEEGIRFYFEHSDECHTLVLAETLVCPWCPVKKDFEWQPEGHLQGDIGYVCDWNRRAGVSPLTVTLRDFDFHGEDTDFTDSRWTESGLVVTTSEYFEYPGGFSNYGDVERYTRLRTDEQACGRDVITGESTAPEFTSGHWFLFSGHFRGDQTGQYVLTSVEHDASQSDSYSTGDIEPAAYRNRFTCVPFENVFRPPRRTPKPLIAGPQTAFVTGPKGEEIYTDAMCRVKVQFHWDRIGKNDERSSCWVRVGQTLAGSGWGSMQIPRVGHEVIVEFLNGDPDRPLITGSVYHSATYPPYPSEKTKTTLKTLSTPGGHGFNELRFDDAKDKEQVFIHAQRNFDLRVLNDQSTTVLGETHSTFVKDHLTKIAKDQHLTVGGDQNQKVNGTISIQAGSNWQQKVGSTFVAEAGEQMHLKAGENVVIESGFALTLKVGNNFISIQPEGIIIQGSVVLINSGGDAAPGPGAAPNNPKLPQEADSALSGDDLEMKWSGQAGNVPSQTFWEWKCERRVDDLYIPFTPNYWNTRTRADRVAERLPEKKISEDATVFGCAERSFAKPLSDAQHNYDPLPNNYHPLPAAIQQEPKKQEEQESSIPLPEGAQRVAVKGDGNCLFRAIAVAQGDCEGNHAVYRAKAIEHMRKWPDVFNSDSMGNDLPEYLRRMGQPASGGSDRERWGGQPEIVAMSRVFQRRIIVHRRDGPPYVSTPDSPFPPIYADMHLNWAGECHYEPYIRPR
jgi:type VI secretion system secreted protein VgrG